MFLQLLQSIGALTRKMVFCLIVPLVLARRGVVSVEYALSGARFCVDGSLPSTQKRFALRPLLLCLMLIILSFSSSDLVEAAGCFACVSRILACIRYGSLCNEPHAAVGSLCYTVNSVYSAELSYGEFADRSLAHFASRIAGFRVSVLVCFETLFVISWCTSRDCPLGWVLVIVACGLAAIMLCLCSGKPRGMRTARKLRNRRRVQKWADKQYKKAHLGTRWKANPFGGSSHAKGIVVEKLGIEAKQACFAIPGAPSVRRHMRIVVLN